MDEIVAPSSQEDFVEAAETDSAPEPARSTSPLRNPVTGLPYAHEIKEMLDAVLAKNPQTPEHTLQTKAWTYMNINARHLTQDQKRPLVNLALTIALGNAKSQHYTL